MRNALSLYKILLKNTEVKLPKNGTKGVIYSSLGIIAISCIMIPCCLIVGFISYIMTSALVNVGASAEGLLAEIHIMSAFSMIFGILVIFNIMFFSSDREHLIPLPFRPHEIMLAKFAYSYVAESVMEFMVLIAMFIGFFLAYPFKFVGFLSSIISIFLIPLVPLSYCVILSLIIVKALRHVKNSKIFNHISTLIMILFVILFLCSFNGFENITVENYINSLINNSNLFTNILNYFFFPVPVLLKAIQTNSLLYLLLYILENALVLGIMLLIGYLWYQDGLYTIGALGNTNTSKALKKAASKQSSKLIACIKKEILVLTRTKAYNSNCVFINILWPLLLIVILLINKDKPILEKITSFYNITQSNIYIFTTMGVVFISFVATAMNSLASTAFSREGLHLELIKYIPVPYRTTLLSKAIVSYLFTLPPLALTLLIYTIYFKLPVGFFVLYLLIATMCVVITTAIGLYLDSSHPHTSWDDEYSALRGNLNSFFDMALVMTLSIIICTIPFALFYFSICSFTAFHIIICTPLLILTIFSLTIAKKSTLKHMSTL